MKAVAETPIDGKAPKPRRRRWLRWIFRGLLALVLLVVILRYVLVLVLPTVLEKVAAGFDLTPEILRMIKAGTIRFTIDQQPYIQGFYPVVQLTLLKRYGIMPASMDAGAAVIAKDQADSVLQLTEPHFR